MKRRASKARLLAIGRRCAAGVQGPPVDHGDLLYDERGLPRQDEPGEPAPPSEPVERTAGPRSHSAAAARRKNQ